jgi:glutaconate CoA-transferase subunit A
MRGYIGSDLPKFNSKIKNITCPFTGEMLAATPALRPDVTILHAQRADKKGNVLIRGIVGVQKEAALAAKSVIVTVEEVLSDLNASSNDCVLPSFVVSYVCQVPHGAPPSYAYGYYDRDNGFYKEWDAISRDRNTFQDWMRHNVLSAHGDGFHGSI